MCGAAHAERQRGRRRLEVDDFRGWAVRRLAIHVDVLPYGAAPGEVRRQDWSCERAVTALGRRQAGRRRRPAEENVAAVDSVDCSLAREAAPWSPGVVLVMTGEVMAPECLEAAWHVMCDDTSVHGSALNCDPR